MNEADIAITAGGVTLYELCTCGTPSISYFTAENQRKNIEYFDENQVIYYAGRPKDNGFGDKLIELLNKYSSETVRKSLSTKMQTLVDGHGADRLAKKMIEYSVEGVK